MEHPDWGRPGGPRIPRSPEPADEPPKTPSLHPAEWVVLVLVLLCIGAYVRGLM